MITPTQPPLMPANAKAIMNELYFIINHAIEVAEIGSTPTLNQKDFDDLVELAFSLSDWCRFEDIVFPAILKIESYYLIVEYDE